MPAVSKIRDEAEAVRWIEEGRTYAWIVEAYLRKYDVETTLSMWSNFRRRRGLSRRIVRDDQLIPWSVDVAHRWAYPLMMLRFEARRRAGAPLGPEDARRLDSWRRDLTSRDAVVLYDAQTPDGFHLVPREAGDEDIIRRPTAGLSKRRRAD